LVKVLGYQGSCKRELLIGWLSLALVWCVVFAPAILRQVQPTRAIEKGISAVSGFSLALWLASEAHTLEKRRRREILQEEAEDSVWSAELGSLTARTEYDIAQHYFPDRVAEPMQATSPAIPIAIPPSDLPLLPLHELLDYPAILIFGPQGSGKTSLATYLLQQRLARGHTLTVLDPHAEYGQYGHLQVVGAGMDYQAIDQAMDAIVRDIDARYKARAKQKNLKFKTCTTFCDEFTNWASRCSNSGEFFKTCVSDTRKVEYRTLLVAHARTLPALGDAKGMAATRDASLLEIELEAKVDPLSGKAVPAMRGKLKYPGQPWQPVAIAPWMQGDLSGDPVVSPHNPSQLPHNSPQPDLASQLPGNCLEDLYHPPSSANRDPITTHNSQPNPTMNAEIDDIDASGDEVVEYPGWDLPDVLWKQLIESYRAEGMTTQVAFIEAYCGLRPGGNNVRYDAAKQRYQQVCRRFGL
jgi:hypothetical protein